MTCDVLIIGAGIAGLAAAISAAAKSSSVILLERNPHPGKKLLLTGAGQCNITHQGTPEELSNCYGQKKRFVLPALFAYPPSSLLDLLAKEKVPTFVRDEGKIFPRSLKSRDVRDALVRAAQKRGITILSGTTAEQIQSVSQSLWQITTSHAQTLTTHHLILATGGVSFPQTGSTGDGFRWSKELGHRIIPPTPALTAIATSSNQYLPCAGISLFSPSVEQWREGKKIAQFSGNILWTHRGLSGPAILNQSRYLQGGDLLKINLTQFSTQESVEQKIQSLANQSPKRSIASVITELGIPERFVKLLFQNENLPNTLAGELLRSDRKKIAELLFHWPFLISRKEGWSHAMTTAGGIDLRQVDRKTMRSRLYPNLSFAGEILDVDGNCGGYNLQWGWSSGSLAGDYVTMEIIESSIRG